MNNLMLAFGLTMGIYGAICCLYFGIVAVRYEYDYHEELSTSVIVGGIGVILVYLSILL